MAEDLLEAPALLLLNRNGIEQHWEEIRRVAEFSTPPEESFTDEGALVLLESLQQETAQAWMLVEEGYVRGVALTQLRTEPAMGTNNLIILGILSMERISITLWREGLKTLKKFATAKGCAYITGFTTVPGVVEVAKRMGGDLDFTFVRFKVGD